MIGCIDIRCAYTQRSSSSATLEHCISSSRNSWLNCFISRKIGRYCNELCVSSLVWVHHAAHRCTTKRTTRLLSIVYKINYKYKFVNYTKVQVFLHIIISRPKKNRQILRYYLRNKRRFFVIITRFLLRMVQNKIICFKIELQVYKLLKNCTTPQRDRECHFSHCEPDRPFSSSLHLKKEHRGRNMAVSVCTLQDLPINLCRFVADKFFTSV